MGTSKKNNQTTTHREMSDVFYEQGVRVRTVPVEHPRTTSRAGCANVDATIAPIVYALNQNDLPTLFSCSGLVQDHDRYTEPSSGYIEFPAPDVSTDTINDLASAHELLTVAKYRALRIGGEQPILFLGIPRQGYDVFEANPTPDEAQQQAAWRALDDKLS